MAVRSKKQINNAENHLIVGSIEVLGDIKGSTMQTIRRNVETLQTQYKAISGRTKDYWSDLSNDNLITPVEKLMLKKEFETIEVTHAALMSEARSEGIEELSSIIAYENAYNALRYYLYTTLKLFDEMSENTEIADREVFNGYYSDYYASENFVQTALAIGTVGSIDILVVSNLNFEGTEEQVVIYNGELYQYLNGHWKKLGFNGYCGVLSATPANETEGFYFLARNNFSGIVKLVSPEGMYIVGPEDKILGIQQDFDGAYIYECINKQWVKVADKNDNRYVACLFDYYLLTGQFPPIIQGELDNITEELDEKLEHVPEYLGARDTIPAIAFEGDWFLWSGATITSGTITLQKGYIYKYTKNVTEEYFTWEQLNPADTHNSTYYMGCLDDILTLTDVIAMGTFGVIFASAFFGHSATIDALKTKTIVLTGEDGLIKSELYTAGSTTQKGFVLKADGTLDCVKGTFQSCDITGNATIGGNATFYGIINSGPFYISPEDPSSETFEINLRERGVLRTDGLAFWLRYEERALPASGWIPKTYNGTIGGIGFAKIYYQPTGNLSAGSFRFHKIDGSLVAAYKYDSYFDDYDLLPEIIIEQYTPGKTFKLLYLPTSAGVTGSVYKDADNYLRVSP